MISHWVYGGLLASLLLLVLSPLLISGWSEPLVATFLLLPAYRIHQYEEHDNDRFRHFINKTIGQGFEVLSLWAVFFTNIPGVWGVIALSLYFAVWVNLGWALVAVYLVLVNAMVHIVHAIIFRWYNPGLITSIVLFVPLGSVSLYWVARGHAVGLGCSLTIHGAIVLHFQRRLTLLRSTTNQKKE